jgi:hypothetical protein
VIAEVGVPFLTDPMSIGLVAVGADKLGERDALRMTSNRKRPRGQRRYLIGGGTIAVVGVLGILGTFVSWTTTTSLSVSESFLREGGHQLALSLAVVGAGLVAYGSALPEYRVHQRSTAIARVRPQVSRRQLGLALTWRY